MSPPTPDLGRVLTAMVTPFKREGGLDLAQAERLADYLVANGNDGLVVCGTTGESPTLAHDEKLDLLRAVRGAVPGHPVVMGTGSNDTAASISLSREALGLGADAVMAVVPYYNKPPQKSLYAHFRAIAEGIDGPVMMYNVPSRTIANLAAETSARLSEVENIVALKEASTDLSQCAAVAAAVAPGFRVYSGEDSLTLSMMAVGFHGVVSVAGHFAGPGIARMVAAFAAGATAEARRLNAALQPIFREVFCTTSPVPTKALFRHLGFEVGDTRLPLVMDEISDEQLRSLAAVQAKLGDLAGVVPQPAAAGQ
ncbi:MAG: 4-hydroxy-tetrahydrodipicolinate synthase [Chloroflexota bacterium]|jgi:4-hydroxy-tetrahydrodipicolinate synthase|nr:4-hydroxy-tetrahydrodipicolinate synthase [Chloroflexota bacterium]